MIIRARAPLRLGLAGGGTDVSPYCDEFGGVVLNATIGMYAYAAIKPLEDSILFHAADINVSEGYETKRGLPLHRAVYDRITKQFNNDRPLYCRLTTNCDVRPGSGLGGSSTLVVAMVHAFVEWLNLPLGDYEVARLAYEIERHDAHMPGGRQDQYAAAFGGINYMEFYNDQRTVINPLRIKGWIMAELESRLLLFDGGESRDSGMLINAQNRGLAENGADLLHIIRASATYMKDALLTGNFGEFEQVMKANWETKRSVSSNVVTPFLNEVYETALSCGATAGKISGAGGGGFLTLLVDPIHRVEVMSALSRLGRVYPVHLTSHGAKAWRI